jgi:hypothetical protein
LTQSGHRQVAQLAHAKQSLEVLASVVAAASESLLIVRQYALDYVEHADDHIRPSLIGQNRANRDEQISRCAIKRLLAALPLHGAQRLDQKAI